MSFLVLVGLKIISLIGALLNTAGFIGFFAFTDTLGPYKWQMLIVGCFLIALSEGLLYLFGRKIEAAQEGKDDGQA